MNQVPTMAPQPRFHGKWPASRRPFRYIVAALAVFVAIATLYLPEIGRGLTSILFLAVLIAAWYGGLGPGLAATALTVIAAIPPDRLSPSASISLPGESPRSLSSRLEEP